MTYDWKKTIVSAETDMMDILSIIDRERLRIALVADENLKLLGVITDGDIRRHLLTKGNLNLVARDVMNATPTVASLDMSNVEMESILQSRNHLGIPIVDRDGILNGLYTLESLYIAKPRKNPVFIMAGGFGTRLRPMTNDCPKPMLKVGGRPILETILESCLKSGFRDFYFSTHYLAEIISDHFGDGSKFGCSIKYVHESEPLGTGGALGLLPRDLPDLPLIMINGDILTKVDFHRVLEDHVSQGAVATMVVRQHLYQVPYGVVEALENRLLDIVEKPTETYFVNAGIYVIDQSLVQNVKPHQRIDLPTLLKAEVKRGQEINLYPIHEYWQDIGLPEELLAAKDNYGITFDS